MQKRCDHHHHEKKSDIWTKLSATSGISTYISDTYWFATLFDLTTGFEGNLLPISWYALGFGFLIATLSAGGSTYCHWILNKNHQHVSEPKQESEASVLIEIKRDSKDEIHGHHHHHGLSFFQKAALVGDFISHTGEVAGPITFVVDLAAKNNLPLWANIAKQSAATFFGVVTSVADVRTCYEEMKGTHPTLSISS